MKIIKALLFYPLLWLRGIVLRIGRLLSGLCLLGVASMLILKSIDKAPNLEWTQILMSAVMAFAIFMLLEFYDQLLLKLNPTSNKLTLYK